MRNSFEPEDLLESRNVPQVTRCVEELAKLVKNCHCYEIKPGFGNEMPLAYLEINFLH